MYEIIGSSHAQIVHELSYGPNNYTRITAFVTN